MGVKEGGALGRGTWGGGLGSGRGVAWRTGSQA